MLEKIAIPGLRSVGDRLWSQALRAGPWVLLSGQVAVDHDQRTVGIESGSSTTVGPVDPAAQWRQALGNIKELVEAAGGTMADVVKCNVYVTDVRYYVNYQHIRGEFFSDPYPVSTAFVVHQLVHPDWIIEIEAEAYIPE